MTVALLLGVTRLGAARCVFLLSLPAVLAAAGKEVIDVIEAGATAFAIYRFALAGVTAMWLMS